MMGVLYDAETNTINYHLKKVFADSELQEDSVIRSFRTTAVDSTAWPNSSARPLQLELMALSYIDIKPREKGKRTCYERA